MNVQSMVGSAIFINTLAMFGFMVFLPKGLLETAAYVVMGTLAIWFVSVYLIHDYASRK